jgi:hypothetical protein
MNIFVPSLEEKREYYRQEAEKLRFQAREARKLQDEVEASRLEELASEADSEVASLDAQIHSVASR